MSPRGARPPHADSRPVLITGGSGFIGSNLAHRLASAGRRVLILDNLSRPGVERNLAWLRERHGGRITFELGDVRERSVVREAVREAGEVYHFAAQVAVTTSLTDPREDFEINAAGTLNLLEGLRARRDPPPLVFCSTNKVYGHLADIPLRQTASRYLPDDPALARQGIGEERPLQFHSPYGCSKGAADQYVLDHARCFGLPATVFRMSCIYGPRQCGTEDQGWVAHFLIRALHGEPITIYGDGKQVRDLLFVEDLLDAFQAAQQQMERVRAQAFNIGGGPRNAASLVEVLAMMRRLLGRRVELRHGPWRTGDQSWYVSDTRRFRRLTGWRPRVGKREGIRRLAEWLKDNVVTEVAGATVPEQVASGRAG